MINFLLVLVMIFIVALGMIEMFEAIGIIYGGIVILLLGSTFTIAHIVLTSNP